MTGEELSGPMGIPIDQLIVKKITGPNSGRGTWGHPQVAINCRVLAGPTTMAQANGKLIADYLRLDSTNAFLEELSETMGIPIVNLVDVKTGRGRGVNQLTHDLKP